MIISIIKWRLIIIIIINIWIRIKVIIRIVKFNLITVIIIQIIFKGHITLIM